MRILLLTLIGCLSLIPLSESKAKFITIKIPKGMYYKNNVIQPSNYKEFHCMVHVNHSAQLFGKEVLLRKPRALLVLRAIRPIGKYRLESKLLYLGKLVSFTHSRYKKYDKKQVSTLAFKLLKTRLDHYSLQLNIVSYQMCTGRYGDLRRHRHLLQMLSILKKDYNKKNKIKGPVTKPTSVKKKLIKANLEEI